MIVVDGLKKRFGAVTAVDGVSFTAPDGLVTGLLGPNGAGKTTTLRVLCTLMRPDEGRATIDGHDVEKEPMAARAALGVLPDAHGLYPRLTTREHVRGTHRPDRDRSPARGPWSAEKAGRRARWSS